MDESGWVLGKQQRDVEKPTNIKLIKLIKLINHGPLQSSATQRFKKLETEEASLIV